MPTLQIYDQLLQFPLFQGMSRDDLEIVAGHTRFGFTKMPAGKLVIKNGSACQQMFFLINGSVKIQSYADDNGYSVEETVSAPFLLQLESAFGYYQCYTHDFTTTTDVNFLLLERGCEIVGGFPRVSSESDESDSDTDSETAAATMATSSCFAARAHLPFLYPALCLSCRI